MHGGTSRGPVTAEGLERSRRARWKHGYFSRAEKEHRRAEVQEIRDLVREMKALIAYLPTAAL